METADGDSNQPRSALIATYLPPFTRPQYLLAMARMPRECPANAQCQWILQIFGESAEIRGKMSEFFTLATRRSRCRLPSV